MRLAVISDVHGNVRALEAVLADIARRGVDATVNLGDCVAGPLWPRETYALLDSLKLPTVRGNHDRWVHEWEVSALPPAGRFAHAALDDAQRSALHALPATIDLGEGVLAVHGTPSNDSEYLTEETLEGRMVPARREVMRARLGEAIDWALVLCGHSHRQSVTQVPGGCLIVNPGTVGCPVFADIANAGTWEWRSPHARYAVVTKRGGRWAAELLAVDYDWDEAARVAEANGFARWAAAYAVGAVAD